MKKFWIGILWLALASPAIAATHLPFIQDDYSKAHMEANRRKVPLFVEVWAPW